MSSAVVPLKRLVRINERSLPETTEPDFEFGYVDIGSVGRGMLLDAPIQLTFANAPSRARRVVRAGDTIISTVRTYLGAVWPVKEPTSELVVSTGFAVLTPRALLDSRYLGWLSQSDSVVEEIVARSVGVSYPAINALEIGDLRVPLMALTSQRAIADFLDAETARIDALITKKRRLAHASDSRLRARIGELTAAGVTVSLNRDGTTVAQGWRAMRLRRCFTGIDYGIGEVTKPSGEVAVLGMANIDDHGEIGGEPGGFVDSVDPRLLLRVGDLLFNRTNSLAKVGKLGLVRELTEQTTFASYLVRFRTSALGDANYLNYALNTDGFLGLARSTALPSIGQANLNPSRYTELRIVLPSLEEQRRIVADLDGERRRIDALVAILTHQIALLQERRQALITAAVTGELDLPGVA